MLLIEPPVTCHEWVHLRSEGPRFFSDFANDYVAAVMALPCDEVSRIVAYLCDGVEDTELDADMFHGVV